MDHGYKKSDIIDNDHVVVCSRFTDVLWHILGHHICIRLESSGLFADHVNGIGFEPKFADRIFGIFQRLHGRDEYEGTGIGLAICQKIAVRHGGNIVARGRPGEGATFVVTMLLSHDRDAKDHERNETDHDRSGG